MAEVVRYVNTNADAGGDGTTNATSSGDNTHAYNSMSAWEAAEQTDLVTATDTHVVHCCGGADSTSVTVSGWTTNATYFITVKANRDEADGFNTDGSSHYSTSHYRITNSSGDLWRNENDYTVLDGIQLGYTGSNGNVLTFAGSTPCTVQNCRVVSQNTDGGKEAFEISGTDADISVFNNIVRGNGDGTGILLDENCIAYNNTVDNFDTGISAGVGVTGDVAKNNAVINCTTDISGVVTTIDYNASEAGDGTNAQTITSIADTFVDATGTPRDYRPKAGSVLLSNGVGSGSDANVPTTDLLGNARSTTAPTIGAFENIPTLASRIIMVM